MTHPMRFFKMREDSILKSLIIFLAALTYQGSQGQTSSITAPFSTPISCQKHVETFLNNEFSGIPISWERVIDEDSQTQVYRASRELGHWYELQISEQKAPRLFYLSAKHNKDYEWNKKTCALTEREGRGLLFKEQAEGYSFPSLESPENFFTDADLKKVVASGKSGIIYVWSPRMVYSVTEFRVFRDVAKKLKIDFIPVLDPFVSDVEARGAAKSVQAEFKGRRLASVDLYMRSSTLHFPTVFVYGSGKINSKRVIGVLPPEGLKMTIREWLKELN